MWHNIYCRLRILVFRRFTIHIAITVTPLYMYIIKVLLSAVKGGDKEKVKSLIQDAEIDLDVNLPDVRFFHVCGLLFVQLSITTYRYRCTHMLFILLLSHITIKKYIPGFCRLIPSPSPLLRNSTYYTLQRVPTCMSFNSHYFTSTYTCLDNTCIHSHRSCYTQTTLYA